MRVEGAASVGSSFESRVEAMVELELLNESFGVAEVEEEERAGAPRLAVEADEDDR